MRVALLAGAATLAGGCGTAKKGVEDGGGKGDGTVLVQGDGGDETLSDEEKREREAERQRQIDEMDRRNRDRGPEIPYGCVWPDDEVHV